MHGLTLLHSQSVIRCGAGLQQDSQSGGHIVLRVGREKKKRGGREMIEERSEGREEERRERRGERAERRREEWEEERGREEGKEEERDKGGARRGTESREIKKRRGRRRMKSKKNM